MREYSTVGSRSDRSKKHRILGIEQYIGKKMGKTNPKRNCSNQAHEATRSSREVKRPLNPCPLIVRLEHSQTLANP